jgi:hypothetical protein
MFECSSSLLLLRLRTTDMQNMERRFFLGAAIAAVPLALMAQSSKTAAPSGPGYLGVTGRSIWE